MYKEEELWAAAEIIRKIAERHCVPEAQVRKDMKEAMNRGRRNPDPSVQALWATFCRDGEEPAVEAFILWAAGLTGTALGQ